MERGVYFIKEQGQVDAFSGLILPEVLPRLEEPAVFLLGAVEGNRAVGAAVMELEESRAQLLSVLTVEDRRRQGIGSALLRQCVRALRRTTIQSLYAILTPEETAAAALFAAFGMTVSDEDSAYYRFSLADAAGQAVLGGGAGKALPLERLPRFQVRDYLRRSFPGTSALNRVELFDPKVSQLLVENGEITACLLAEREETAIVIDWMATHSQEKLAILYLMRGALAAASAICPPETEVRFATYDPVIVKLIRQLFPKAEAYPIQSWELSDGSFRLTDTTPTGWEERT